MTAAHPHDHAVKGTLKTVGRDLTALARAGQLKPVVGRDALLDDVIDVLCRQLKRNPLLVGPAGAGKTMIVEGLAQRVAAGTVPARLSDMTLIEVSVGAMIASTKHLGQLVALTQELIGARTRGSAVS